MTLVNSANDDMKEYFASCESFKNIGIRTAKIFKY